MGGRKVVAHWELQSQFGLNPTQAKEVLEALENEGLVGPVTTTGPWKGTRDVVQPAAPSTAGATPAAPVVTPAAPVVTPAAPVVTPAAPPVTPAAPPVTPANPTAPGFDEGVDLQAQLNANAAAAAQAKADEEARLQAEEEAAALAASNVDPETGEVLVLTKEAENLLAMDPAAAELQFADADSFNQLTEIAKANGVRVGKKDGSLSVIDKLRQKRAAIVERNNIKRVQSEGVPSQGSVFDQTVNQGTGAGASVSVPTGNAQNPTAQEAGTTGLAGTESTAGGTAGGTGSGGTALTGKRGRGRPKKTEEQKNAERIAALRQKIANGVADGKLTPEHVAELEGHLNKPTPDIKTAENRAGYLLGEKIVKPKSVREKKPKAEPKKTKVEPNDIASTVLERLLKLQDEVREASAKYNDKSLSKEQRNGHQKTLREKQSELDLLLTQTANDLNATRDAVDTAFERAEKRRDYKKVKPTAGNEEEYDAMQDALDTDLPEVLDEYHNSRDSRNKSRSQEGIAAAEKELLAVWEKAQAFMGKFKLTEDQLETLFGDYSDTLYKEMKEILTRANLVKEAPAKKTTTLTIKKKAAETETTEDDAVTELGDLEPDPLANVPLAERQGITAAFKNLDILMKYITRTPEGRVEFNMGKEFGTDEEKQKFVYSYVKQIEEAFKSAGIDPETFDFSEYVEGAPTFREIDQAAFDIDLPFQRGSTTTAGMNESDVLDQVNEVTENWARQPNVVVYQSYTNLPSALRQLVHPDAIAFLHNGEITIIADNVDPAIGVKPTLYHEALAHLGLRGKFGSDLTKLLTDIYNTHAGMRKATNAWLAKNPETYQHLPPEKQRILALEEVIAEELEKGPIKNVWLAQAFNRLAYLVRSYLRKINVVKGYTNNDVMQTIMAAQNYMIVGEEGSGEINSSDVNYMMIGRNADLTEKMHVNFTTADINKSRNKDVSETSRSREMTGWHEGADGKWRYEISDHKAQTRFNWSDIDNKFPVDTVKKLGDFLKHDELFKAYPALKDLRVLREDKDAQAMKGYGGYFMPPSSYDMTVYNETVPAGEGYIAISSNLDNEGAFMDILVHELQHWVQNYEGFTPGHSPDAAIGLKLLNKPDTVRKIVGIIDDYESGKGSSNVLIDAGLPADAVINYSQNQLAQLKSDLVELAESLDHQFDSTAAQIDVVRARNRVEFSFDRMLIGQRMLTGDGLTVEQFLKNLEYRMERGEREARDTANRRQMTPKMRREFAPGTTEGLREINTLMRDGLTGDIVFQRKSDTDEVGQRRTKKAIDELASKRRAQLISEEGARAAEAIQRQIDELQEYFKKTQPSKFNEEDRVTLPDGERATLLRQVNNSKSNEGMWAVIRDSTKAEGEQYESYFTDSQMKAVNTGKPRSVTGDIAFQRKGNAGPKINNKDGIGLFDVGKDVDYLGFKKYYTPSQFLQLATGINFDRSQKAPTVDYVKADLEKGEAGRGIGSPFLQVNWNEKAKRWDAVGHEGRHRMEAIRQVYGEVPVEVHIFPQDGKRVGHWSPDARISPEMQGAPVGAQKNAYNPDIVFQRSPQAVINGINAFGQASPSSPMAFQPFSPELKDKVLGFLSKAGDVLLNGYLGLLSLHQMYELYGHRIPGIKKLDEVIKRRASSLADRRDLVAQNVRKWHKVASKYEAELPNFYEIAHQSTIDQIDVLDPAMANNQLTQRFNKLPAELKQMYSELRKAYENQALEMENILTRNMTPTAATRLRKLFESRRVKVYFPLYRTGDYWLTFNDKSGETVTMAFENPYLRYKAQELAVSQGATNPRTYKRLNEIPNRTQPQAGFMGDLMQELQGNVSPDVMDAAYEIYMNYLPASSVRQMFRARDGVKGFQEDLLQVYADVGTRMANQLNNMDFSVELEEAVSDISTQAGAKTDSISAGIVNNIAAQMEFVRNPNNGMLVNGAGLISYYWNIAGNISSAIINTIQLPMAVYPTLGLKYGMSEAWNAMSKAREMYLNGGTDTNTEFMPDLTFGADPNLPADYKKLYKRALEMSAIRRSVGNELNQAQNNMMGNYTGISGKVKHGLGYVFQNTERFNREMTILAAYKLARQGSTAYGIAPMGVDEAIEEAIRVSEEAHGSALVESGPRFFQQGIGKIIFTFKRFAQNQIYVVAKTFHRAFAGATPEVRSAARRQILGIYAATWAFAGLQGLPGYGLVEMLASLLMDDDDDPYDFDEEVRTAVGDLMYKGLLNQVFKVDVASRIGFNGMLWRDDPKRLSEVGPMTYAIERIAGPAYGTGLSFFRGLEQINNGEAYKGFESMIPAATRNLLKGFRFATEGARNSDGVLISDDIEAYGALMQTFGFAPAELAEARARAGSMKEKERKIMERRSSLIERAAAARRDGDFSGYLEIQDSIAKFNYRNPEKNVRIDPSTIDRSIASRLKKEKTAVDGVYITPALRLRLMNESAADEED
jgi:hypothetical protein